MLGIPFLEDSEYLIVRPDPGSGGNFSAAGPAVIHYPASPPTAGKQSRFAFGIRLDLLP